jgi:hypothetical protein
LTHNVGMLSFRGTFVTLSSLLPFSREMLRRAREDAAL